MCDSSPSEWCQKSGGSYLEWMQNDKIYNENEEK